MIKDMSTQTSPWPPTVCPDTFAEQGYTVLRNLIPHTRLQAVRDAIDARVGTIRAELAAEGLCSPGPLESFARNLCFAGKHSARYGRSWTQDLAVPAVHALHRAPELLNALAPLLGPDINGHRQFNLRPKLPGQSLTVVPWHQDTGYYGEHTAIDTILTVWMPLVPVDADNGCMQVLPGSHRQGAIPHRPGIGDGEFLEAVGGWQEADVLTLPMQPGDALVMHNLVLHRSGENRTEGIRWSIDARFFAPDTPSASRLLCGFPRPWLLTGPDAVAAEEWAQWYRS
jgi:ectoine hydroxylase-related dioxygenase (phytanoyl-CoA dioxygenase family)